MHNNVIYYYQNDGHLPRLFTSDDLGTNWQEQSLTGLPQDCNIREIVEGQDYFYYGKNHTIYYSSDGIKWDNESTDLDIVTLYMCMNVKNFHDVNDTIRLWMAARDAGGNTRFYTIGQDLVPQVATHIGLPGDTLPRNFPIEDFATIPFWSSSLHQHGVIAGGYDRDGKMTNARWNLEYNYIYDEYHLTNMALDGRSFPAFAGTSISYYNNFIYLLGGIHNDRSYLSNVFISLDEGAHWSEITNSDNSKRPENVSGRYHTNTFVHGTNLYIIGGEDNSTTYSDVYRGRMNSIGWPAIGD